MIASNADEHETRHEIRDKTGHWPETPCNGVQTLRVTCRLTTVHHPPRAAFADIARDPTIFNTRLRPKRGL